MSGPPPCAVQEGRAAQSDIAAAGETAPAAALDRGGCVADLSAVHTLQLLPGQARAAAREQLPGLAVSPERGPSTSGLADGAECS